jgi:hypothetical protein
LEKPLEVSEDQTIPSTSSPEPTPSNSFPETATSEEHHSHHTKSLDFADFPDTSQQATTDPGFADFSSHTPSSDVELLSSTSSDAIQHQNQSSDALSGFDSDTPSTITPIATPIPILPMETSTSTPSPINDIDATPHLESSLADAIVTEVQPEETAQEQEETISPTVGTEELTVDDTKDSEIQQDLEISVESEIPRETSPPAEVETVAEQSTATTVSTSLQEPTDQTSDNWAAFGEASNEGFDGFDEKSEDDKYDGISSPSPAPALTELSNEPASTLPAKSETPYMPNTEEATDSHATMSDDWAAFGDSNTSTEGFETFGDTPVAQKEISEPSQEATTSSAAAESTELQATGDLQEGEMAAFQGTTSTDDGFDDWADSTTTINGQDDGFADFDSFGSTGNDTGFDFGAFPDQVPPTASSAPQTQVTSSKSTISAVGLGNQPSTSINSDKSALLRGSPEEIRYKVQAILQDMNTLGLDLSNPNQSSEPVSTLESLAGEAIMKYKWESKDSKRAPKPAFRGTTFETNFLAAIGKQPLPTVSPGLFALAKRPGSAKKTDSTSVVYATPVSNAPLSAHESASLNALLGIQTAAPSTPGNPSINTRASVASDSPLLSPSITGVEATAENHFSSRTGSIAPIEIPLTPMDLSMFGPAPTSSMKSQSASDSKSKTSIIEEDSSWMNAFSSTSLKTEPTKVTPIPAPTTADSRFFRSASNQNTSSATMAAQAPMVAEVSLTPSTSNEGLGSHNIGIFGPKAAETAAPPGSIYTVGNVGTSSSSLSLSGSVAVSSSSFVSSDVVEFEDGDVVGPVVWELLKSMPSLSWMNSVSILAPISSRPHSPSSSPSSSPFSTNVLSTNPSVQSLTTLRR